MEQHYDDTFLARWLANELTAEELSEFKNSQEYEKYAQIVEMLDTVEIANFDVETNLQSTLHKLNTQAETKKKKVIPLWSYAAAASIAVLFFVYSFFFTTTTYTSQLAEQIEFDLPDGSHVDLNAGSTVTFKKGDWDDERSLELEGEAYFKVEKGSTFTVHTDQGKVTVLGTQFVVNSRDGFYNVICYEGKVKVITENNDSVILTKGKAFVINKDEKKEYNTKSIEPSWIRGTSAFQTTSIKLVLEELERQFDITINGKENVKPGLFTGSFSHKDVKLAVKTVFTAMEIPYKMDAGGNVVIQKP